MRRGLLSVAGAALLAILLAPSVTLGTTKAEGETVVETTVAVQRVNLATTGLRDEAAMVLVGTALIVLAGAVRRTP